MDRLGEEAKAQAKEKENLEKKLNYLELTYKNSRENFDKIIKSTGGVVGGD